MKTTLFFAAAALVATPSLAAAQDAHADHEGDSEMAVEIAPVSDAELDTFVSIVIAAQALGADESTTDEQKQQAFLGIIGESSLGLERFSQIAEAVSEDEALQERMQVKLATQLMQG